MAYQDEFARAQRVARAKMAFYVHLAVYLVVNALLIAINLLTSAEHSGSSGRCSAGASASSLTPS